MKHIVSPFGGFTFLLLAIMLCSCSKPDYRSYYDSMVQKLSDESLSGRSVYNNGDIKSARIIVDELLKIRDIQAMGTNGSAAAFNTAYPQYKSVVEPGSLGRWNDEREIEAYLPFLQSYQFPMNVMRGDMSVSLDGIALRPTLDFTAKEFSPSCHGDFKLAYMPDDKVNEEDFVKYLGSGSFQDCFVVIDWDRYLSLPAPSFERYLPYLGELDNVGGIILRGAELFPYFKARSYYTLNMPVLMVCQTFPSDAKSIRVDIDAQMLERRDAHNVIAYLPGRDASSKEYVTFIAHYDHLGLMGRENVFPGANDNASGVAMLLALAKYFSENRPDCGIQFIFLDAEEANLLGAFYYCENPALPLEDCKYLINLDMVADTSDRLATEASDNASALIEAVKAINAEGQYPPFDICMQELSDNSDHYAFALKGVPSTYYSTEGDFYQHYHSPRDSYGNTTLENFDRLFNIFTKVVK